MLYPYRLSSLKNRHRWTFGALVPETYAAAQDGLEPCEPRLRMPARGGAERGALAHGPLPPPITRVGAGGVASQEGIPREVAVGPLAVEELAVRPVRHPFGFTASEPGVEQRPVAGVVEVRATKVGSSVFRVGLRVTNTTAFEADPTTRRDEAMPFCLASTHVVLAVEGGAFVSLLDPPEPLREAAEGCQNEGAWPVLVGPPGARKTPVPAPPIILDDYPRIAPESPGEFFDGTEIDEMLPFCAS